MIVVDTSAVIAILAREPSATGLLAKLAADEDRIMSVASYLEAGTVLAGRRRSEPHKAIALLDRFVTEAGIRLEPVDLEQGRIALQARVEHGRGMGHGGLLNFGDCFAYALAIAKGAPLLFVGNDFNTTDLLIA